MKKLLLVTALSFSASFAHAEAPAAGTMDTAPAATFSEIDSDKDGKISRQEASSFSAVEISFDNADANKDGALDIQEFAGTQPAR